MVSSALPAIVQKAMPLNGVVPITFNKIIAPASLAVLSRKRADAVVEYLVAKHDLPIYRIHMIGLGEEKPLDEAHNRAARAKNRRVEVKVFSADQMAANTPTTGAASRVQQ